MALHRMWSIINVSQQVKVYSHDSAKLIGILPDCIDSGSGLRGWQKQQGRKSPLVIEGPSLYKNLTTTGRVTSQNRMLYPAQSEMGGIWEELDRNRQNQAEISRNRQKWVGLGKKGQKSAGHHRNEWLDRQRF